MKMSNNQLVQRENEARAIVAKKMKQINTLVGHDEKKASKFGSALVQLSQNKNLKDCNVESVIDVGFQIVQAGLNPNPLFGQAYVVPFKLKGGFTAAQLQVGYKGYIQLGYRAGWKFKAVPVYKVDNFDYKFGGFEDEIILEPDYDKRNEDDGKWVFENLLGVIVYAKDKDDYIVTEFVPFKKLEKLRLKSQNQVKDKLQYIWLEWAEEMYKAKAIKYVVTRLPIEDDITELVAAEDEVYRLEDTTQQAKIQQQKKDINSLNAPRQQVQETLDIEIETVEVKSDAVEMKEALVKKGVKEEHAEQWCTNNAEVIKTFLNDPASIDVVAEELMEF
jgi:recombination protein RecT